MAKAKQVLDVRVSKGITTSQSNEHQRRWTEKGWEQALEKGNYDPSREHLNFEIVSGKVRPVDKSRSIPERMAEILDRRGIKDPNEGLDEPKYRTVVNIIFGGSRDRMRELAFGSQKVNFDKGADNSDVERKRDIERWAKDVYAFVSGRYGEQNIAAFIVHLDEINPHVHCTLLPIKDGRFAYKEIFAGKDKYEFSQRMKQLHTDFFTEVNTKWGMSRGRSVSETGARHLTTEEYRRMLSEECTTFEENIDRHRKVLFSIQSDIRLAERRVKGLTTMVDNLEKSKAEKQAQLSAAERDLAANSDDAAELEMLIESLQKELQGIDRQLADKQVNNRQPTGNSPTSKRTWMPSSNARRSSGRKPTGTREMSTPKWTRCSKTPCWKVWSANTGTCRHGWTLRSGNCSTTRSYRQSRNRARRSCTARRCSSSGWSTMPLHLPKRTAAEVAEATLSGGATKTRTTAHGHSAA